MEKNFFRKFAENLSFFNEDSRFAVSNGCVFQYFDSKEDLLNWVSRLCDEIHKSKMEQSKKK